MCSLVFDGSGDRKMAARRLLRPLCGRIADRRDIAFVSRELQSLRCKSLFGLCVLVGGHDCAGTGERVSSSLVTVPIAL